MPRIELIRFIFCSATVCLALSLGESAQACPEINFCQYLTNGSPWGRTMSNEGERIRPPERRYDPMQGKINQAVGIMKLVALSAEKVDKLTKDPRFHRYHNGGWDFFQSANNAAPGEYCTAFFWKKDGLVRISGPGGDYKGALLTFWGQDIPRPENMETIRATLSQSDGSPQTVKVFNYILPGDTYGAISFAVPTIEAALDAMKDVERFDIEIEGKSVAKVEWHSGLMARDKLRECVNARASR